MFIFEYINICISQIQYILVFFILLSSNNISTIQLLYIYIYIYEYYLHNTTNEILRDDVNIVDHACPPLSFTCKMTKVSSPLICINIMLCLNLSKLIYLYLKS